MEQKKNIIEEKSKAFALRGIELSRFLVSAKKEYTISNQCLRSSMSIGANVAEGKRAQSYADFISKNSIALKEASETEYWLYLLHESGYIDDDYYESLDSDCKEIIRILIAITKHRNDKKEAN